MKKLIALFVAALVALQSLAAPLGATSPTGPTYIGSMTYASLTTNFVCDATRSGFEAFASDWGANGTKVRCNATRWLPINGQTLMKRMSAVTGNIANTETILDKALFPINALQNGDMVFVRGSCGKSGTTDTMLLTVRWGTAGTTSDTALTGLSSYQQLSAGSQSIGFIQGIRIISATSAEKLGAAANSTSAYGPTGAAAAVAAVTTSLSDASANAIYITVSAASGGATNTIACQELSIIHEAG